MFHEALEELLRQSRPTIGPYLELMPMFSWNGEWFCTARGSLVDLTAVDDIALWSNPLNPASSAGYDPTPDSVRDSDQKYIRQLETRIDLTRRVRKLLIRAVVSCRCGLVITRPSVDNPVAWTLSIWKLTFSGLMLSSFTLRGTGSTKAISLSTTSQNALSRLRRKSNELEDHGLQETAYFLSRFWKMQTDDPVAMFAFRKPRVGR